MPSNVEEHTRGLLVARPELAPVLRTMLQVAEQNDHGEFSQGEIADQLPTTPSTLTVFVNHGIIGPSPRREPNSGFYVFTNRAAVEGALGGD